MAPGTKRIAVGGLVLALAAWVGIDAYLPEQGPPAPEPRDGAGLAPIPEREARRGRADPATPGAPRAVDAAALAEVLAGCFSGMREDGATIHERYAIAADGAIEGEYREVNHDGSPASFETMRIVEDADGWRYHPAPGGVPASVSFQLVASGKDHLRFANPAHDFPRVIEYRRQGTALVTHVEGVEDGQPKLDDYTTVQADCPGG